MPEELTARPIEDIRAMRAEAQAVEVGLSYVRRLVHGRLDIVGAELRRRGGGGGGDLAALVADLPGILSEGEARPGGPGRLPTLLAPGDDVVGELHAELDAVVAPERISAISDLDDGEVSGMLDALAAYEREISARRRDVHARIDALQAELTRRYKSGEASVESLLR